MRNKQPIAPTIALSTNQQTNTTRKPLLPGVRSNLIARRITIHSITSLSSSSRLFLARGANLDLYPTMFVVALDHDLKLAVY